LKTGAPQALADRKHRVLGRDAMIVLVVNFPITFNNQVGFTAEKSAM
jgi:hypothetical protein